MDNDILYSVVENYKQEVKYTYSRLNSNTLLIDHFIVSVNIINFSTATIVDAS